MAWKKGPLPPETYFWGGVVKAGDDSGSGFYFADFCGDHVVTFPGEEKLTADQVAWYDNSLELPPVKGVRGRVQE
jgi:hypothetical protein